MRRRTRPDEPVVQPGQATAGVLEGDLLLRLETALWVYDFSAARIVWANPAALTLWDAGSVGSLAARDMRAAMSASVKTRLEQHFEDFRVCPEREIREFWTLYPKNMPLRVRAILRRCELTGGGIGMLVEARAEDLTEPETIRSADALLHAQTIIALFDQDGQELYANPAFRGAFGPGQHVFGRDFTAPADLVEFHEGIRETGEHRATVRVRTTLGERWHDIHAIRCRDAVTGDGAFLISASDVTMSRQYQQQLKDARDLAESAGRMKSQFLRLMSHEMRTPLNGVLGMANILANSRLDERQRRMLEAVLASGERMLELVNNVLELVAIDSRSVELVGERFDPVLLVQSAVSSFSDLAEQKGLRILTSFSEVPRDGFYHDVSRIRLVLRHLISNAIKFTRRGFVAVRTATTADGRLRFEVADSGVGIPEGEREKVFARFYQVDGSLSREQEGAGVGLAICKELVEMWGGDIGVESEHGRGSLFWFSVPPIAPAIEERPVEQPEPKPQALRVVPLERPRRE